MDKQWSNEIRRQRRQRTPSALTRKGPQTIEQRRIEVMHWNTLGDTYTALGLTQRAITCYKRSRSVAQSIDPQGSLEIDDWNLLTKIGVAYQTLGETRCAITYHAESLRLARVSEDVERQLDALSISATFMTHWATSTMLWPATSTD